MLKKRTLTVFALVASMIIGTAATMPEKQEEHEPFKNLKVLPKNISHDDLEKVMHHYNKALGVKCNFCHAKSTEDVGKLNFASDEKEEKNMARSMMKMTTKLNRKNFGTKKEVFNHAVMEVSCNTCHRGQAHPKD